MHKCIVCEEGNTYKVIELGYHPPADTFLKRDQISLPRKRYPLNCFLCKKCGHLQNEYIVPQEERYVENDYSYTSSNSKISREHWRRYCITVSNYVHLEPSDHVIEFGSNDGYLLKQFIKKDAIVTGIEPSPNIAAIAQATGVYTIKDFLGDKSIKAALKRAGKAKIILGNNVLNHIAGLNEVVPIIRAALKDDGYFVFESPYHKDTIKNYLFDMIYHEHVSYFSVRSANALLKRNKMYITNIENTKYHSGCIRVYASKKISDYNKPLVDKYIKSEYAAKIFYLETYKKFMSKITKDKFKILENIYSLKRRGKKIAAIGAGARGNTRLNFYLLDRGVIDFVTDSSPYKIGKYTPGSLIPIVGDKRLSSDNIDVGLILSWNIGKYLVQKTRKINNKMKFIVPGEKRLL